MGKKIIKFAIFFILFLIFSLLIFCILDYVTLHLLKSKPSTFKNNLLNYKDATKQEIEKAYIFGIKKRFFEIRKTENTDSKNSIAIFGDLYVYGIELNDDETISHHLSKYTKKKIFNRASGNAGAQHMYYQLSCDKFYNIVKNPEYIFYFYTPRQIPISSIKLNNCQHDIFYKLKNNKLIQYEKIPFYKKSYLIAYINYCLFQTKLKHYYFKLNEKLYEKLVVESYKQAKNHAKNCEFIIVLLCEPTDSIEIRLIENFKEKGIKIFKLYNYINCTLDKYNIKNKHKPNSLYWDEVASIIAKEFKL